MLAGAGRGGFSYVPGLAALHPSDVNRLDANDHALDLGIAVQATLIALRQALKPVAQQRGVRLTYMPLLVKLLIPVLKEFPIFNASMDEEKREMRQSDDRARRILERTETMPMERMMKLHGTLRELRSLKPEMS